jgi:FlaA1/EpsC-like NDP-sugar epimerase
MNVPYITRVSTERVRLEPRELGLLARAVAAKPVADPISPVVLIGLVRLAEFIAIAAIGGAAYGALLYPSRGFAWNYAAAIVLVSGAAILAFQAFEIYSVRAFRTHVRQLYRLALAWTLIFLIAFVVSSFGKFDGAFSRWAASWFCAGLFALFFGRFVLAALVRRWARDGRLIRRIVVVGGGREGESLIRALEREADSDVRIIGMFDDRADDRTPPVVAGIPKLGSVEDLILFTRLTRVDLVLVAMPLTAEERVLKMVRKLWVLPVDVRPRSPPKTAACRS